MHRGGQSSSWLFYHRQFSRRPRNRHGRSKSEVRNRAEAYSLAGLGWAEREQRFAWAMHLRESCDCNTRAAPEHGWVRYLNPFYKIEI